MAQGRETPGPVLSKDQARRMQEIFDAALSVPASERDAFVRDRCDDDALLLSEVRSLLLAHAGAGDFLTSLDMDSADVLIAEDRGQEPRQIGPYRILRELGHGGMGSVYLAERADGQFEQHVALKLIRRGLDIDAIHQRFLTERQILARLQHPHIARLLDGGVDDDGRPYFAMEYVDGLPITDYADAQGLAVEQRLRLFQDACAAVGYAHRNLVVHRDLKPSNMLVTADGQVKLLDFGIAKLLESGPHAEQTLLTQLGMRAMTPEYAAPEQARREPVTTATDVYALGVVLYRLLTGALPHRFEDLLPASVIQVISESEPQRPSAMVLSNTEGAPTTQQRRLARRLTGDLDTIVLAALRKEPERRYRSPEALAQDIELHLRGLPVQARPDTVGYRASRFIRRNRMAVSAAAIVLVSILAALGGITWQATVASAQRDLARSEAAKANEVRDFVLGLFEVSDPSESLGDTLTAVDLLDRGVEKIEDQLGSQPAVQAEMRAVIGNVYVSLGRYEKAQEQLERSLEQRRQLLGEEHLDVASSLNDLGRLRYATSDFAEAEQLMVRALQLRRERLPAEHPDIARNLNDLALVRHDRGALLEAESLYREAWAAQRSAGPPTRAMANTMNNLAVLLQDAGRYDEAEALHRQTLNLRRELFGELHPDVAESYNNLAYAFMDVGELAQAGEMFRRVLEMDKRIFGEAHPNVAITLDNLATVLVTGKKAREAIPLLEEAAAIHRSALEPDHTSIGISLTKRARALTIVGRLEAAEASANEALTIFRDRLGPRHPYVAGVLEAISTIRRLQRDFASAEVLARQALAIRREVLPENHVSLGSSLTLLGAALVGGGDAAAAEAPLREALAIRTAALPARHWQIAETSAQLGACLSMLGRLDEAGPLLRDGYAVLTDTRGDDNPFTRLAAQSLAAHESRVAAGASPQVPRASPAGPGGKPP